jgi:cholest-4-en-3-one 26-monooxygenase
MAECPFHKLIEPTTFQSTPVGMYQQLAARTAPVWIDDDTMPEGGAWAVGSREQMDFISTRPALFSSSEKGFIYRNMQGERLAFMRMLLLGMDPPEHRHYRKVITNVFKPQAIDAMMPEMRKRARAIIDKVALRGECEFVTEVAAELPLQVICDIVGVPQQDRHDIMRWANATIGRDDPRYNPTGRESDDAEIELFKYGMQLGDRLLADTGSKALGREILLGNVDGERISPEEYWAFFYILLLAGTETTRTALTNGMYQLIQHPEQLQLLREQPALIPGATEEMLRFDPPITRMQRTAQQDIEVGGVQMKKGDRIILFYPAPGHDAATFDAPEQFDVRRGLNPELGRAHRAFGVGEHFCLGHKLARAEMIAMLEQIIPRLKSPRLLSPMSRIVSPELTAAREMHIAFEPESHTSTAS